jgi:hypothetical protein
MSRTDKIRQVAQQAHDNGDCECVTITISREDAELLANPQYVVPIGDDPLSNVIRAARAALEGER